MQVELLRFRKKILTLLTLETLKWTLSRMTCLRLKSRSHIGLFDSNYFKLHFNHIFRFQMFAFLTTRLM